MLPLKNRLYPYEIRALLQSRKRVYLKEIQLAFTENKQSLPRFAFIVPARVAKHAVSRNRIKRTISESVRHLISEMEPINGVFTVKQDFANLKQPEVENLIRTLLHNAGVLI